MPTKGKERKGMGLNEQNLDTVPRRSTRTELREAPAPVVIETQPYP